MINIPNSPGFDIDYKDPDTGESKVVGKALPIMTMLHVITNNFEVEHYSTTASIIVLIVFLLVGVIVMLNLLIAVSYFDHPDSLKAPGFINPPSGFQKVVSWYPFWRDC